ncbi:hypothetical protein [Haloarcula sp. H-GB5]|jgi:hypothetical protein|uniref:Uncharacterized protein n=2 Tax=Haloarcula hispanica TaxID=51589 RepID=A0A5J5LDL9_HALHI|nr:hypothetical protein EGO51_19190 [Haloarcula hispanica]
MQDTAEILAARWEIMAELERQGELQPISVRTTDATIAEYAEILITSIKIFQTARQAIFAAEEQYNRDIERRIETDGRVIDPSMPVRFSGAITDIAAIIERAGCELNELNQRMEQLSDSATFGQSSYYEEQARSALTNARKIIEIAELHPQTHLWLVWINESLSQASQIHYKTMEQNRFENHNDGVFTYVAHPPLVVATVGCTATIEEVGAFYLNKFTDRSHEPDNTSSKEVLRDLKATYERAEPELVDEIIETVVNARNDLSHYVTRREGAVPIDDMGRYIEICQACVKMTGILVREMADLRLEQFHQQVISSQ